MRIQFIWFKSDVIVNSTSKDLNLNTGILSKSIFESAGPQILNECKLKYPNGIDSSKIAVTTAGKIKDVKYLYHVAPPNYSSDYDESDLVYIYYKNLFFNLISQWPDH